MPTRPAGLGSHAEDLTGRTFFGLTALHPTGERRGRGVVWACRCACGRRCEETSRRLLRGDARSCGCHRRKKPAGPKRPRGRPRDVGLAERDAAIRRGRAAGMTVTELAAKYGLTHQRVSQIVKRG